ncbi:Nif3-like dinuclear metal center hexameric protein [Deinococcus koreensis]|uniref:NGG1p interacting factor NIF3 n=1 Tax=Deinococcus koreensis TaxID=2054903 RepID=A0A2K3UUD9_9DEIO|nr:Nif3-like dinuclear metal center hexameric protein [Deinococcus koreensis]PNY80149.1 NGG1p interacting factor NIF3 [Deinococcus koreensis]
MSPATLEGLARWLHTALGEDALKRPGLEAVRRLELALEPADVPATLEADALFLHRSRHTGDRWPGVGVLGVHDAFDLQFTTGPNRRLAGTLGWTDVQDVTWEGRLVGLQATPPQRSWPELHAALVAALGGEDSSFAPAGGAPLRLALMNAMNPALLEHVARLGVTVYLTGQLRPSAVAAARTLGLGVVALGHRRTELWGLRRLAQELEAAFPGLETVVYG